MQRSEYVCLSFFLTITFKMASAELQCLAFDPEYETVGEFLKRFQVQMSTAIYRVRNGERKQAALLLRALPIAMVTDLQRRIASMKLTEATYDIVKYNLLESYSVKKSEVGAAVQFFTCKQEQGQSIEDFSKKLKFLASSCGFEQQITLDRLLRDVFIAGLNSAPVLSAVLQSADKMSFSEAINKAKLIQQIREDTVSIQVPMKVYSAEEIDVHKVTDTVKSLERKVPSNYVCNRCGQSAAHWVDKCFALSIVCRKCNKKGHLAKVCRSKKQSVDELTETAIHTIASGKPQVAIDSLTRHPPTIPVHAAGTSSPTPPATGVVSVASTPGTTATKSVAESNFLLDVNDIDHFLF